jgi:glutathione S-transferase
MAFLRYSNIDFQFQLIDFTKGEHLTPEYTLLNPYQTMPAIKHGDYTLWESAAIIAYLAEAFNLNNSWYPQDPKVRGRVNAYLHWHHQGTRDPCMNYLVPKVIGPKLHGAPELTEEKEEPLRSRFNQFLADVKWLIADTGFAARTAQATIADVFLYNELSLVTGLFSWDQHPEVKNWYDQIGAIPQVKELTDQALEIVSKILG